MPQRAATTASPPPKRRIASRRDCLIWDDELPGFGVRVERVRVQRYDRSLQFYGIYEIMRREQPAIVSTLTCFHIPSHLGSTAPRIVDTARLRDIAPFIEMDLRMVEREMRRPQHAL
jgi:hypothetical protein